jgi:hypothetical protein
MYSTYIGYICQIIINNIIYNNIEIRSISFACQNN